MAGRHDPNSTAAQHNSNKMEHIPLDQPLTNEQVIQLLYNHTDSPLPPHSPDFTDDQNFPELPPATSTHALPPQYTTTTPMDDSPILTPLARKRPISPDTDGFTLVKTKNSRGNVVPKPNVPTTAPTPTSNPFNPLRTLKPPPIILPTELYDQSAVTMYIKKNANVKDYRIQSTKDEVRIFCPTTNDYENIISVFKNPASNVSFYTFSAKGTKKNKKYLIMGLDLSHPLDSIKAALTHKDLIDVRRLTKTDKSGKKTAIEPILATFSPDYDYNAHLKTIRHIDNVIIYQKLFKEERTVPQCHRCQRWGHTKNHCNMEMRCVRCSGSHSVTDCPRDTTPLHCANCGLEHPASYRGCTFRMKLMQTIEQRKAEKARPSPTFIPAPAPSQSAWRNPHQTSQLLRPPTDLPATSPYALPLPTPTPQPQPPQPLIPQPPTYYDPNTPPRWVTDLTQTMTSMFTTVMSTVNNLVEAISSLLTKK